MGLWVMFFILILSLIQGNIILDAVRDLLARNTKLALKSGEFYEDYMTNIKGIHNRIDQVFCEIRRNNKQR